MEIIKNLEKLGLSRNEAKVYTTLLQLGRDTVLNISRQADLKRPSVYLLLDDLEARGLVTRTRKGKKTLFKAENPKRLLTNLKIQEELARDTIPSLAAIHNLDPKKPNIKIAEGAQGVRNVYGGIFTYMSSHPGEELLIYGSLKAAAQKFAPEVVDFFSKEMGKSKNKVRELGNDDPETRRYFRKAKRANANHELRLVRPGTQPFEADNMLYGNTLVILSVDEQIFATIIESAAIANTYRALFELAWRAGKKYAYP